MAEVGLWLRRFGRRSLFLALRGIARTGGFRRAPALGKILGELEYRLAWRRRQRCAHDMALALGRPIGDPWVQAQLRRAHHLNAHAALEILAMLDRHQNHDVLAARAQLEGTEHLRAALAGGRGAVLLGTHAGNGVLFAALLAAAGLPVSIVYRQARMMSEGFLGRGCALYGLDGISADEGLHAYARMLRAIRRGHIVFVTVDQGVKRGKDGIAVRFLGKDMVMAAGPAQLSRHARAPVLPVFAAAADGRWRFRIEPPLAPASGALAAEVEKLARASERQVLLHPEIWSWHHRRWHKHAFPRATMPAEPEPVRGPTRHHTAP